MAQINADQFIGIGIVSTRQNVASVMDNMQKFCLLYIYLIICHDGRKMYFYCFDSFLRFGQAAQISPLQPDCVTMTIFPQVDQIL